MARTHAVVWLDLHGAAIFEFGDDDIQKKRIKADSPFRKVHRMTGRPGSHPGIRPGNGDVPYFDSILKTVASTTDWAIVGRNMAARALDKYVERHDPRLKKRLIGVEAMERPSDPELLAHCARLFKAARRQPPDDHMTIRLPAPPHSHTGPIRLDQL